MKDLVEEGLEIDERHAELVGGLAFEDRHGRVRDDGTDQILEEAIQASDAGLDSSRISAPKLVGVFFLQFKKIQKLVKASRDDIQLLSGTLGCNPVVPSFDKSLQQSKALRKGLARRTGPANLINSLST